MSRLTVLGLTLSLLACKGDPKPPPPVEEVVAPTTSPDAAAPAPDAAAPDAAAPDAAAPDAAAPDATAPDATATDIAVKLVSNGAEPRTALRYTAKADDAQATTVAMTTTLALKSNGQDLANDLPKTRLALTTRVASVDANGATLTLSIDDADVDGSVPEGSRAGAKLAEVIRGMKGMRGTKVANLRGVSGRFVLAYPEGQEGILATAALKPVVQGFERAIDQMTVPFPDEAVGVGATWEVSQEVVEAGMRLTQKTVFTLDKVEGDTATVRFTTTLSAPPGPLESEIAGGVKANVKSLAGDGTGSLTVSLGKLMPVAMTLTNKLVMTLELGGEGADKRALDVTMGVSLEASSK